MSSMPTTASSSSSSSAASLEAHHSCIRCRKRMSTLRHDKHTICGSCRDTKCDFSTRCGECRDWDDDQLSDFIKHGKSLDFKSEKKADSIPPASTASSVVSTPSVIKDPVVEVDTLKRFESRITENVNV